MRPKLTDYTKHQIDELLLDTGLASRNAGEEIVMSSRMHEFRRRLYRTLEQHDEEIRKRIARAVVDGTATS